MHALTFGVQHAHSLRADPLVHLARVELGVSNDGGQRPQQPERVHNHEVVQGGGVAVRDDALHVQEVKVGAELSLHIALARSKTGTVNL